MIAKEREGLSLNLEKYREDRAGLSNLAPIKKIEGAWITLARRCISLGNLYVPLSKKEGG